MLPLTRRAMLGSAAAATTLTAIALPAGGEARLLILHRNLAQQGSVPGVGLHAGAEQVVLDADVVRHWRAAVREQFARAGVAVAYVPWAEATILAALVREEGGAARISRIDSIFKVALRANSKRFA